MMQKIFTFLHFTHIYTRSPLNGQNNSKHHTLQIYTQTLGKGIFIILKINVCVYCIIFKKKLNKLHYNKMLE